MDINQCSPGQANPLRCNDQQALTEFWLDPDLANGWLLQHTFEALETVYADHGWLQTSAPRANHYLTSVVALLINANHNPVQTQPEYALRDVLPFLLRQPVRDQVRRGLYPSATFSSGGEEIFFGDNAPWSALGSRQQGDHMEPLIRIFGFLAQEPTTSMIPTATQTLTEVLRQPRS